ncbi:PorT family protein [Flavobacterium sp. CYK-4]|uniref:porin family protein n=1 Tax=Flavobacterium lotistagni TaxID=2709660 RepID=UPI00140C1CD4|nr:porin family protein [Flavobacterium lotistagni]NHM05804.1 PorT family protein [Flavobacterium lotistagni]
MRYSFIGLLLITLNVWAQDTKLPAPMIAIDSLYREDQFYFTFTYNTLANAPAGVSQKKFSSGFKLGFLRDFPINKQRNKAIAPGLGLSYNKYFQNLFITEVNGDPFYSTTALGGSYSKNKFEQVFIDFPIEFRWRTSGPESHKFWRVYTGLQFSYLLFNKSVYEDDLYRVRIYNNKDFNKFQAGAYLAAGHNSWNVYAYYGILPIFKSSAKVEDQSIKLRALHFGLMFYIL